MKKKTAKDRPECEYDVCLSFAGENRQYVERAAKCLRDKGIRVFYDEYEQANLWGKDLYTHLDYIYGKSARYCVLFASKHYARKLWSSHERRSAQARALHGNEEYVLPARFDDTAIPGLLPTVGYVDLQRSTPNQLANLIEQKVGPRVRENYLPPVPDRLFAALRLRRNKDKDAVFRVAWRFLDVLKRMKPDERQVVYCTFIEGCSEELPINVHVSIDLLRRITSFTPAKILRLVSGLRSLGFWASTRDQPQSPEHLGADTLLVLEWHDMSTDSIDVRHGTAVACEMIRGAVRGYCEEHGNAALEKLDFGQLASITTTVDEH